MPIPGSGSACSRCNGSGYVKKGRAQAERARRRADGETPKRSPARLLGLGGAACIGLGFLLSPAVLGGENPTLPGLVLAVGFFALAVAGLLVFGNMLAEAATGGLSAWNKTVKRCPECAEREKAEARVCKHCGHRFAT